MSCDTIGLRNIPSFYMPKSILYSFYFHGEITALKKCFRSAYHVWENVTQICPPHGTTWFKMAEGHWANGSILTLNSLKISLGFLVNSFTGRIFLFFFFPPSPYVSVNIFHFSLLLLIHLQCTSMRAWLQLLPNLHAPRRVQPSAFVHLLICSEK